MSASKGASRETRSGTGLLKRLGAGGAVLGIVATGAAVLVLNAGPASAENASFRNGYPIAGPSWIGNYTLPGLPGAGSDAVYCGANGIPLYPSDDVSLYDGGTDMTGGDDYALAWAMSAYGDDGNSDDAAAVDGLVSQHNPDGVQHDYDSALALGLGARMDQIWADSVAHAGPWTITFDGLNAGNTDNSYRPNENYTGTVHVQGPNGPITGVGIQLSVSAGANVAPAALTTDAAGNASFTWNSSVAHFSVSAAAHAPTLRRWEALDANETQTVTGLSQAGDVSGSSDGYVDPVVNVSFYKYDAADPTQTPVAGAVLTIVDNTTGQTFGPYTTTTAPTVLDTQEIFAGDQLTFTETTAPNGFYMGAPYSVVVVADGNGAMAIGVPNKQTPTPAITTKTSYEQAQVGRQISDVATVTGNDGEAGVITDDLFRVDAPEGAAATYCQNLTDAEYRAGTKVGTYTREITGTEGDGLGNGDFTIVGPVVDEPGCYHWFETVKLTLSGVEVPGPENQSTESTLVTSPAIKTQINQQVGAPGDILKDAINVTGITESPSTPGGTVDVHLFYKPFTTDAEKCADVTTQQWIDFIAAHPESEVFSQEIDLDLDGQVITDGYTVPAGAIGCYTYTEGYTGSKSTVTSVVTQPGEVTETSTIVTPQVSTQMGTTDGDTKTTFVDTAVVTGTHGATVTLHVDLLGPVASANGTDCTGVDFTNAAVAGTFDEIQVNADGTFTTNAIELDKADVAQCYVGYESLVMVKGPEKTTPEKVFQGEKGVVTEIGLSTLRVHKVTGSKGIDTGHANDGGPNLVLILGGAGGLVAAAAIGFAATKRRRAAE